MHEIYQDESTRSQDPLIRGSCMICSKRLFSLLWILNCMLTHGCGSLMEAESHLLLWCLSDIKTYLLLFLLDNNSSISMMGLYMLVVSNISREHETQTLERKQNFPVTFKIRFSMF